MDCDDKAVNNSTHIVVQFNDTLHYVCKECFLTLLSLATMDDIVAEPTFAVRDDDVDFPVNWDIKCDMGELI
jgi:hypothetical protein